MVYSIVVTLHIIFAGMWLFGIPLDYFLRGKLKEEGKLDPKTVKIYLAQLNLTGMLASTGILLSGIFLVTSAGHYDFFDFSSNHWLVSKQVLLIIIFAVIGGMMIPAAKKVRTGFGTLTEDELKNSLGKVFTSSTIVHILVILNFLFALSRNFM